MRNSSPKIGYISLGCPKALVDSERIITKLRADGYELVSTYKKAQLVIINTCGFVNEAINESLANIKEALAKNGKVIVTGCLGARPKIISEHFPEVLKITGPQAYEEVIAAVHKHVPPNQNPFTSLIPPQGIKLTPRHYAYVKISEGCNHHCSFCIIPSLRGKLKSRPIAEVMTEAHTLINAGVKELLIISQDTSAYGIDTRYALNFWQGIPLRTRFYDLSKALSELKVWVRLHYVYPYPHVDTIIPLMAEGKILPYIDVPFQHASPRILKMMKRPANTQDNLERIYTWRKICPQITIRSTFIVGFPGETEKDFQQLLNFIEEAQLDRVGCFKYSPVLGAKANNLSDAIPEGIKEERFHRFMETQEKISKKKLQEKINKTIAIIIDEITPTGAIARSTADAPEIDGLVFLKDAKGLVPGDIIEVKVIGANEHDLFAVPCSSSH
jgi:ribosomal protein S12 methylthiotransferase